ncbi:MAG: hypothetical protein ACBZ72_03380 [Candidatus Bathyarchaeia archaeon]
MQRPEEELNVTTFQIYLYLVKAKEPAGPRDIMRAMNISSPGVVHRHLQKLADWGWVCKDAYGRYLIKKKVGFKGYVWLGKTLLSTSILFACSFVVLTVAFIAILVFHLTAGSPIDESFAILTVVTVVASSLLLAESLRPRRRQPKGNFPSPA